MARDKKKDAKKGSQPKDLLDSAALALKKFRKVTKQIGKLSTGQKLVGGAALLAAGLTYLAKMQADTSAATGPAAPARAHASGEEPREVEAESNGLAELPRKRGQSRKSK